MTKVTVELDLDRADHRILLERIILGAEGAPAPPEAKPPEPPAIVATTSSPETAVPQYTHASTIPTIPVIPTTKEETPAKETSVALSLPRMEIPAASEPSDVIEQSMTVKQTRIAAAYMVAYQKNLAAAMELNARFQSEYGSEMNDWSNEELDSALKEVEAIAAA